MYRSKRKGGVAKNVTIFHETSNQILSLLGQFDKDENVLQKVLQKSVEIRT